MLLITEQIKKRDDLIKRINGTIQNKTLAPRDCSNKKQHFSCKHTLLLSTEVEEWALKPHVTRNLLE